MGDRANFGVRQGNDIVFLYGHTAGYRMMATLANALQEVAFAGRIHDETYGTRILFSQIVGSDWSTTLGWGISVNHLTDNEHKVPVVDFREGTVSLYDYTWRDGELTDPVFTQSIDNFIKKFAETP